eukprot:GGOE01014259.1.p1 GENE.GGOE01014259.1~~GGOE01014259.1.p1  ORF type:complete len:309 (+),score=112.72 GGOE01014259.1:129-1055(+)
MHSSGSLARTIGSSGGVRPAASAHNDPDPRRRLEAALQLLSVYEEQSPAVDDRDLDRLRAATTNVNLQSSLGRGQPPDGGKGGGGKGEQRLRELQKRIFVSDTIMKKLHNKNKALQREVNALREQIAAGGAVPVSASGDSAAELEQYRKDLKRRDERIRELQLYTSELESRFREASRGKFVGTTASTGAAPLSIGGTGDSAEADGRLRHLQADLEAAQRKLQGLEQHYQDLLSVKVDSVVNSNASTSQINKEVKLFFVALRKKLHDEYTAREAERAAANEQIYLLEKELMNKQVNNKLLESQVKQGPG